MRKIVVFGLLAACSGTGPVEKSELNPEDPEETSPDGDDDDDDDDDDIDTTTETADTASSASTSTLRTDLDEIIGIANIDDDNSNGRFDAQDGDPNDPDHTVVTITGSTLDEAPETYELRVSGDPMVRVWHGSDEVLNAGVGSSVGSIPWEPEAEIKVEFYDFKVETELTIAELDAEGNTVGELTLETLSSPLILSHHLEVSEQVMVVHMNWSNYDNSSMIQDYEDYVGGMFESVSGNVYDDPWIQDEIEIGYSNAPDGKFVHVVIDSIRDRQLDDYPEDHLRGPNVGVNTWGNGWANSLDSFGNLEVSPPVDGYPFGRIYFGGVPGYMPVATELFDLLVEQEVQEPFVVDTDWLCVGHVDEFMSFVPDDTAPRGFRFVYSDIDMAWDLLESMDPNMPLPQYAPSNSGHNIDTVGEFLDDNFLRNYNEDLKLDYLEPILAQMTTELGLLPDEIVKIPGLFEDACGEYAAAVIPGMANLFVVNEPNGDTQIMLADPFMRSNTNNQSGDPFIEAVTDALPSSLNLRFVDDWEVYHMGLGEVHCGSNGIRTPSAEWWQ